MHMKKVCIILLAICVIIPLYSQQDTVTKADTIRTSSDLEEVEAIEDIEDAQAVEAIPDIENAGNTVAVIESPEKTSVTLGENEILIVEENGDTTRVKLGNRGISIVEGKDGTSINIIEMEKTEKESSKSKSKNKKFKPHFAGIDLGLNNFLTSDFSTNLPVSDEFMKLNTARSWNWSINFIDYGIGFGTSYAGIATGMGFEFSWYGFDNQNTIRKEDGVIVEYVPDSPENLTHSRFFTSYLTVPLILEFQIPVNKGNRIHLAGGLIGGAKLWSSTRTKYRSPSSKAKQRVYGDYNLTPLRYGVTARVGYEAVSLYANYYISSLFKENQGPELYPFAVGLAFNW